MLSVIAYDIVDDGTRTLIADELANWGHRVQYSVFEADLDERQVATLKARLEKLIAAKDNIRIYRICQNCRPRCIAINSRTFASNAPYYEV